MEPLSSGSMVFRSVRFAFSRTFSNDQSGQAFSSLPENFSGADKD
jgi:hypothetical protein